MRGKVGFERRLFHLRFVKGLGALLSLKPAALYFLGAVLDAGMSETPSVHFLEGQ